MVELDTKIVRDNEVTFVQATVSNTRGTAQYVRLRNQLDGPTWPPHKGSNITPEWDGDVWENAIPSGKTVGLGFASPAPPDEPALTIEEQRRASPEDFESVEDVIASLDDPFPPREIIDVVR